MTEKQISKFLKEFDTILEENVFLKPLTTFGTTFIPKTTTDFSTLKNVTTNVPLTNIFEDENGYRYEIFTPGITKNDLDIEIHGEHITITGEKQETESTTTTGKYITKELHETKFLRTFKLPKNIINEDIHAKTKNGITTIFIPKEKTTDWETNTRKIKIS
jgi:HSP20 family molecular chaperone IbpA